MLNNQFETQREQCVQEREELNKQIQELQEKLSQEIKCRKEEETSHGEMIMELQQFLNKEREKSDTLNHKVNRIYITRRLEVYIFSYKRHKL